MRLWPLLFVAALCHLPIPVMPRENFIYLISFTSNFVSFDQQFMPWLWSSAIDFQLQIFFALIFLFVVPNRSARRNVISAFILMSMGYTIFKIYNQCNAGFRLPVPVLAGEYFDPDTSLGYRRYYDTVYMNTLSRSFPFLLGLLYAIQHPDGKPKKKFGFLSLIAALLCIGFSLSSNYSSGKDPEPFTYEWTFVYASLYRFTFGTAVYLLFGWVKSQDVHSPVSRFVNPPLYHTLATASYTGYLFHCMIYGSLLSAAQILPIEWTLNQSLILLFVNVIFVFAVTVLLHRLVEVPLNRFLHSKKKSE